MEYAAGGLAALGGLVGLRFRYHVLLPFVGVFFFGSLLFSVSYHLGFAETLLMILAVQALLQGGYFAGSAIHAIFKAVQHWHTPC